MKFPIGLIVLLFSSAGKSNLINCSALKFFLVLSDSNQPFRLCDIIRRSISRDSGTVRLHQNLLSTTTTMPQDNDNQDEKLFRVMRRSRDSSEDYYFQWAFLNRRPMEPLPGRK